MPQGATGRGFRRIVGQDQVNRNRPLRASEMPRVQFSTGNAGALRKLSQSLFSVSDRLENQLDARAEAEGRTQGAIAGATGNFEIQDYGTIRGRAFNQAGIEATISTLETQGIVKMNELQNKFGSDPVKLQSELENYHNGVVGIIDEIAPGQGVAYRQRQTARAVPAIERAKDTRFKLTQDQAEAAILQSQAALQNEIASTGADLFSDNPARSEAAATAIGTLRGQALRIYDAVDPSGRPLFSAKEKAAAAQRFNDQVAEASAVGWFEGQEDKAGAYLQFSKGEFKIDLNVEPSQVPIIDATSGKIRDKPITQKVQNILGYAASGLGENVAVKLVSGGQGPTGKRTGSRRHDHGNAGDVVLNINGRDVTPEQAPELYEKFLEQAAAAGATGVGHYPWGVHIGGGKRAAWGPNTKSNSLDPRFGAAIQRGWNNQIDPNGGKSSVDLFKGISQKARKRIDAEMRSQISFRNSVIDRAERDEEKALKETSDTTAFEFSDRLYNGGREVDGQVIPPLKREDVLTAVEDQVLTHQEGEAFLKAINAPTTQTTDRDLYDEINRRIYAGEDVKDFVLENSSRITKQDATAFLTKNHTLNVKSDGSLSSEEKFQQQRLDDLLTPDGIMAKFDQSAEARKFAAIDEYRLRIAENEPAREVANDIAERAERDLSKNRRAEINKLLLPRAAVLSDKPGQINVAATAQALNLERRLNKISEASYLRQAQLLRKWHELQQGIKE